MFLILVGAPGSGKGTQASFLAKEFGVAHVASGDLFRQALERKTELGLLAKSYMDKGTLVPDEVTIKMVLERLSAPDCTTGCIFDGFPRTLDQASALDKAMSDTSRSIDKAVYIKVADEELIRRLSGRWLCRECQTPYHMVSSPPKKAGICDKCGGELYQRADDNEKTVRERLKVFQAQTAPLLGYYKGQKKLLEVDGQRGIDEVTREIVGALRSAR